MSTILIVDDSMMTQMMLNVIIKEHFPDWTVIQAKDAEEAQDKVAGVSFDYATVDMNMPGLSGLELIPLLQISHPDAKIALLTANIQHSIKSRAEDLGIELLSKPIVESTIVKFLEQ